MDFEKLTLDHLAVGDHGNLAELINRHLQELSARFADDTGDTGTIAVKIVLRRSASAVLVETSLKVTPPERKLAATTAFVSTDPRTGEVTLQAQKAEQLVLPGHAAVGRARAARVSSDEEN
jgi:hypothetical protein